MGAPEGAAPPLVVSTRVFPASDRASRLAAAPAVARVPMAVMVLPDCALMPPVAKVLAVPVVPR